MADEREEVTLQEMSRWVLLALVILVGIGLYFGLGRNAPLLVPAPSLEVGQ
jgi:hypothetical protein